MTTHKSTLAKLLAKENITVQYGNYHTAWFDIKDRILGLPQWKDMGKDVTDLLIGHEVGHALYTPFEGWHDSPEKLEGCPRSYINVIEDARIERHIKQNYAGLIGPMSRGYKKLFDEEFFGDLTDVDWDNVKLIDKINLKAKIGDHIDVPFTDEEIVFFQRAMTTETFEEVTQLCRDILAYTKENTPELIEQPEENNDSNMPSENDGNETDGPSPTGHDDYDKPEMEDKNEEQKTTSTSDDEKDQGEESQRSETSQDTNDEDTYQGNVEDQTTKDEDESLTDNNFRRNEHTLLERDENGIQVQVANEFNKDVEKYMVIPFAKLKKSRHQGTYSTYINDAYHLEKFKTYIKEVKRNVNYAVKEFEMRKAAYRYTRAQTARTGSLDVNRLWSYKTNDDIFARVTRLADAKNHGMMMLIDYSGSMNNTMSQVMDQLLHLVLFCKTVNIPFDVYGFTSTNHDLGSDGWNTDYEKSKANSKESEIEHCSLSMPQIISSTLKKADFEDALYHIFLRKYLAEDQYSWGEREILSTYEEYGSTPLNEALIRSHKLIKEFKIKNGIDKMNLVILSDGEANNIRVLKSHKKSYVQTDNWGKTLIHIDNKPVMLKGRSSGGTQSLLENIQERYNVCTLGFFIADGSWNYWRKVEDASGEYVYDSEDRKPYNREFNKNKCLTFNNTLGYNEFYIVKNGKNFATEDDGFDVADDASTGTIRSQFKKYSKSKKNNKSLLTNFGKAVAM